MEVILSLSAKQFMFRKICYSPNGKQLAVEVFYRGSTNIHIYDINNNNILLNIVIPTELNNVHEICWNYDGKLIAYSLCDYYPYIDIIPYSIKIWNIETNTQLFTIDKLMYMPNYDYHNKVSEITTMVWHSIENKLLYTDYVRNAYKKNSIIFFDCTTQTSNIIFSINYYINIRSMNFSSNGEEIIFLRPKINIDIYNFKLDKLISLEPDMSNNYLYSPSNSIVNFLCDSNLIRASTISLKVYHLSNSELLPQYLFDVGKTNTQCKTIIIRSKNSSISFDKQKIVYHKYNSIIIYHLVNNVILYTIDFDEKSIPFLCWSSIDDSIAILTSFEIKIWKRRVLSDKMKIEIHYNEFTWRPENVINSQNIDVSKFKNNMNS